MPRPDLPPPRDVGALVLHTARLREALAFYRALGLPLRGERHGDGPEHHTCALGPTHFAIFEAQPEEGDATAGAPDVPHEGVARRTPRRALPHRAAGSAFFGLTVSDLDAMAARVGELGAPVVQPPARYPWGRRMLVEDPDGRVVELFERPE